MLPKPPLSPPSNTMSMMNMPALSLSTSPRLSNNYSLPSRRTCTLNCSSFPNLTQTNSLSPFAIGTCNPTPVLKFLGYSGKISVLSSNRSGKVCVQAGKGEIESGSGDGVDEAERSARGESTMPDRFRYLTKEASDPPVKWPWFIALAFLLYAWRAVLFELYNWKNTAQTIVKFVGYLLKLALAIVFHFIGDPITSLLRCIETAIYATRAFYSGIISFAPIQQLTLIIMLASAVLAIGEAAVPNSISSQPYLLTASGIVGYAAVRGYISEPFFWTLLLGFYSFSRLIKKRDNVTSALPVAAVLAAVGEPWVRFLVMTSYLALAISHHSKKLSLGNENEEVITNDRGVPVPLVFAALAIGIRVAAKWAGYRHLTWMIV